MPDIANEDDPVIASYDIYITDAQIQRCLLQYQDHESHELYNDSTGRKPKEFRLKPKTGLVEVDIPIETLDSYDERKGLRYGNALKKSNISQQGGTHGLAGGFNTGGGGGGSGGGRGGGKLKMEESGGVKPKVGGDAYEDEYGMLDDGYDGYDEEDEDRRAGEVMVHQTVGGRVKVPVDGDPIYMLGAFKDDQLHLSPLSTVVQLRPQMHHLDAFDEVTIKNKALAKSKRDGDEEGGGRAVPEARAVDMKVKSAEGDNAPLQGNNELLRKIQEEKWEKYEWVDENDQESWEKYEEFMFNLTLEESAQLQSTIQAADYVDGMSAPRVDPVHPEMTGWAMKARRKSGETG